MYLASAEYYLRLERRTIVISNRLFVSWEQRVVLTAGISEPIRLPALTTNHKSTPWLYTRPEARIAVEPLSHSNNH
jgi:hypothetical protein